MNILFRTTADLSIDGMLAQLTVYRNGGELIVEILPYNSQPADYTFGVAVAVSYNGVSKELSSSPFVEKMRAVFEYQDSVRTITVASDASIVYDSVTANSHAIAWKGDGTVSAPTLAVTSYSGFVTGATLLLEWRITDAASGYYARTIGIWYYYSSTQTVKPTRYTAMNEKTSNMYYSHTLSGTAKNNTICYKVAVALYENESDERDDYVAYAELMSPVYTCSGSSFYAYAPINLSYSYPVLNKPIQVSWELMDNSPVSSTKVRLERALDNEFSWYLMYDGTATSFTDTVTGTHTSVAYRVYVISSSINTSAYAYKDYCKFEPFISSNVYVGQSGVPKSAVGMYVGSASAVPLVYVG